MSNKSIFILADGARKDVFEYLLKKGYLENIERYILEPGKMLSGVTVFPSTTGPAYTPFLMGKFPGPCNLPGLRWFDRRYYDKEVLSFRRFRSYIGLESYLINGDLSKDFKTIFELVPKSVSILNEITRGLPRRFDKTKYSKLYLKVKGHLTDSSNEVDEASGRLLIQSLNGDPDFIFSVFLGIDTYSHQFHPFHKKVIDSYIRLDKYIGIIVDRLTRKGELDNTLIVIGSDHGLTPTHSHFDALYFLQNKGFKPLYYTNVFRHLLNADSSVMVSGNSMAHYYIKSGDSWSDYSYYENITEFVEELSNRPEIDIVCARANKKKIKVINKDGEADLYIDDNGLIVYDVLNNDPLGYNLPKSRLDSEETFSLTVNTKYPDALQQIVQLFDSPRTGDVVLSAKPGFDLRATHENPEHCGSHGSLHKDHMLVPLLLNKKIDKNCARTVDIFPTILQHLGINIPLNIDGKSLFN